LPHIREDGTIGLDDLPAFIQLLEAAFGDPDGVATAERKMREIKSKNRGFSQYYAEFKVIAAALDWNPSALRNALRMGLSEEITDTCTYSDMPETLPAFVTVCQKPDDQIRQRHAEQAVQTMEEEHVSHLPGPHRPQRLLRRLILQMLLDILDLNQCILAQARGGFQRRTGRRGLRTESVYIEVGSTTGRQNAQRGRRLRCLRRLEQKLWKYERRKVLRNRENIRSTQAGWRFG
jgi:hypothetical protein